MRMAAAMLALLALLLGLMAGTPARAQGVELPTFELKRQDGALTLDFAAHLVLPRPVEDALQRGVPVYFVAEAQLLRSRWYWRDERVARVSRAWRLAFQPLTSSWRVSFGGLNQTFATQAEALTALSRSSGWKLADLAQLDPGSSYYVEFTFRLDNTQLPSPMQISLGAQTGWTMGVERTQRVE
ncbi:MAG: DUF4390 domain-containing protein [Rubrivivax sp.]|nr:DUF4390 domain-containing protein [Rubrivivax sp.]